MFLFLKRHQLTFLTASPTQFHLWTCLPFHCLAISTAPFSGNSFLFIPC